MYETHQAEVEDAEWSKDDDEPESFSVNMKKMMGTEVLQVIETW